MSVDCQLAGECDRFSGQPPACDACGSDTETPARPRVLAAPRRQRLTAT